MIPVSFGNTCYIVPGIENIELIPFFLLPSLGGFCRMAIEVIFLITFLGVS